MTDTTRITELRNMLTTRRSKIQDEIHRRLRDGRVDRPLEVGDTVEHSDAGIQEEMEFALLQMRAESLISIDAAIVRLDAGQYGSCVECASEIVERRLRALPFAVRCQACEERWEQGQGRMRQAAQRQGGFHLFPEAVNP